MKIVYLEPRSSFRDNLRSDTLWGIICWGIRTVFSEEKLIEFISQYKNGNGVKISSTYYYLNNDGEKTLFFPRPILKPVNINNVTSNSSERNINSEKVSNLKDFKKIKYVPLELFNKFLTGELDEEKFFEGKSYWEKINISTKKEEILHNTIDRLTNTTYQKDEDGNKKGGLYTRLDEFIEDGGLFFLIDGNNEQINLVEGALRFFNHVGFGGDSSIGKNSFNTIIEEFNGFEKVNDANAFVTLSLYHPTESELTFYSDKDDFVWYDLEARKGKFGGQFIKTNRFWKKSVLMFKEGSVFPVIPNKDNYGQNNIVLSKEETGKFDVYHYGVAFNLPMKITINGTKREE